MKKKGIRSFCYCSLTTSIAPKFPFHFRYLIKYDFRVYKGSDREKKWNCKLVKGTLYQWNINTLIFKKKHPITDSRVSYRRRKNKIPKLTKHFAKENSQTTNKRSRRRTLIFTETKMAVLRLSILEN